MPKTRDGVEVDGRNGTVWVIHGGQWPSAIREHNVMPFSDEEIGRCYSSKAAAIEEAQMRVNKLAADYDREHAAAMSDIADRRQWLDAMRADVAKATLESASK